MDDDLQKISQRLNLAFEERVTRTTDTLKRLRGHFYTIDAERWCDTRDASWHLEDGLCVKRTKSVPPLEKVNPRHGPPNGKLLGLMEWRRTSSAADTAKMIFMQIWKLVHAATKSVGLVVVS